MNEPGIPPLDDDVRALVRRAARVDPAPAGASVRVLERVERIVFGPPGGGSGGANRDNPPGDAGPGAFRSALRLARRVAPLAASFAAGGGVVAVAMHRAPEPPRIVYVDRSLATPPATESRLNPQPMPPQAPEAAAPPSAPEAPRANAPTGALATASPSRDQLTAERQLLDLARGALEREEPERALDATARHERKYPNGALVQEREAMAIRALVMLGRVGEAHERADRFRTRFPQSLLLPTIDATVGTAHRP